MTSLLGWLKRHDVGLSATRRATRTAIIMPALFAFGIHVVKLPDLATFAAFGSFAMTMFVDFGGTKVQRVQAQVALGVVGGALVCLGTLCSRITWLAVAAMVVVGFTVLFAGIVSSVLAGAATSLLLAFILPVTLHGTVSAIPDRLAGWALASAASVVAVVLLWPAPARDPLRSAAAHASRLLARRLSAEVAYVRGVDGVTEQARDAATASAQAAVTQLHTTFYGSPTRPTGLSSSARTVVRLVDELGWLGAVLDQAVPVPAGHRPSEAVCAVKVAAAAVLDDGAELLEDSRRHPEAVNAQLTRLRTALVQMESEAMVTLPVHQVAAVNDEGRPQAELVSALEPTFRAQEMSFAVSVIASNIALTAAADRRSWWQRLLGRQPTGVVTTLVAAEQRAGAHLDPHSVWLHNSIRGAIGLGAAVLVAELVGLQHSFWVVLGTLSVLRSNALSTGQTVVRGIAGTVAGFAIGAVVVYLVGTDTTVLWVLLPVAILFAGLAPAAFSFAAGQAAFTVTVVILFNLIEPSGWKVGLVRIEDVVTGCAVSLVVGLVLWPRGAASALGDALAQAYSASAGYLRSAVEFGSVRCDGTMVRLPPPRAESMRAAASARRLDDAFREYLAERGTKRVGLADVTALLTGVAGLRLAADAVLDLWDRDEPTADGDRSAARRELDASGERVAGWYEGLATALADGAAVPEPLARDVAADGRLIEAARTDLSGTDGRGTSTAVRMIWSGDHLDAARRLQGALLVPAQATAAARSQDAGATLAARLARWPWTG